MAISIVENCEVAPSSGAVTEQMLPLLHFDMVWLRFHLMQNLIFYDFHCSKSHFLETIVPSLKNSLSLTLKHFPPLAGNIIFPLISGSPVSHYTAGDSISLTIAESNADFDRLTGNHPRDADEFHGLVPQLPPANHSSDFIKLPVAAVQVTLFPDQGICIGFTHHHAMGDGATVLGFVRAWASINKFNGDAHLLAFGKNCLPFYDRSGVEDANRLATAYWNHIKMCRPKVSSTVVLPTNKVRGTFLVSEAEIQELKSFVLSKKPAMAPVSTFVVVCARVWTCLAKSAAAAGEEVADGEPEYLSCAADCRARLNPPLPATYFGNCLALVLAESTHGRLKGNEGFVAAVEAIGEAIQKTVNNEKGILDGSEKRLLRRRKLNGKRVLDVAGSPRFDLNDADYGWGRSKKFEAVHIDCNGSVSLCRSGDKEGAVEIGLSMPKIIMEAFANIFSQGITEATEHV